MAVRSIIPAEVRGAINTVLDGNSEWQYWYPWLANLRNTNTFVHLAAAWTNKQWPQDPDPGFDHYVLSGDSGMAGWAEHVAGLHDRAVYVIDLPEVYQDSNNLLVRHVSNTYYHRQISRLMGFTDHPVQKNMVYKASALTGRITQSKVIIFSALQRYLGSDCVLSLNDRFESSNVHHWQLTGDQELDDLTAYFRDNWLSRTVKLPDDDSNYLSNYLSVKNSAYSESALNFTQESFHYSLMYDETKNHEQILSGPFLTEKTFKCLLSQTAFVPVGQFRSYRWLETMGMRFDYGLDLSFDDDPGNISRLNKLVTLIRNLEKYTAEDLFEMTKTSTLHNYFNITSKEFFDRCEKSNQSSLNTLYEYILG